jgi:hypothetical protein
MIKLCNEYVGVMMMSGGVGLMGNGKVSRLAKALWLAGKK